MKILFKNTIIIRSSLHVLVEAADQLLLLQLRQMLLLVTEVAGVDSLAVHVAIAARQISVVIRVIPIR